MTLNQQILASYAVAASSLLPPKCISGLIHASLRREGALREVTPLNPRSAEVGKVVVVGGRGRGVGVYRQQEEDKA